MLCRYVKFDTFHPAVDLGLPVTRVISRVVLQKKLAEKAEQMEGSGVLANDCHVVDYEEVGRWSWTRCWPWLTHVVARAARHSHQFKGFHRKKIRQLLSVLIRGVRSMP